MEAWLKINAVSAVSRRLQKLKITNRTFGLPLLEGNFCESECFYDGLRVGITNFIPQRFLLKNPYDDGEKPLLLVDVYRFGFLLGADVGKDLPARFGIDRELNDTMPQLRYQKVYEFIKVKPLDSIVDSVKNLGKLSPLQILKHTKIHMQLVEQLQPGETLIASTYLSRGAGLQIGEYPFIGRPLVSAGVDLDHVVVSRKALVRDDDKFLLQYSDLKATKFWLGVRGELLLMEFPIIGWEIEKLSKMDQIFEFPASNEHHDLLEKGLASTVPSDDMADFAVVKRSIESVKRKMTLILRPAQFLFDEIDATTIKMDDAEGTQELHIATVSEEKSFKHLPFYSSHNTTLESFVTKDEQVFVKLRMHFENLFGSRKHFKWVYQRMLPLLGKPFILFKPEDVNYYLDAFEFSGEVYILPAGLEKIMAYKDVPPSKFCIAYANAAGELHPLQWCEKLFNNEIGTLTGRGRFRSGEGRRFRNFLNLYVKAARKWLQPTDNMSVEKRDKLLRDKAHKVAKMLSANGFNAAVWKMLQRIAGEENIYRNGILTSRTGGFPAQRKVIEMPEPLRGEAAAQVLSAYKDITQSVQISTDPLFSELQGVFYEPMGEDLLEQP